MTQNTVPTAPGQHSNAATITAEQLLTTLVDVATEEPYAKAACFYTRADTREPCCIIGHVFARLGHPLPTNDQIDELRGRDQDYSISYHLIRNCVNADLPDPDDEVWDVLAQAQASQDSNETWGHAVRNALLDQMLDVPDRLKAALAYHEPDPDPEGDL